MYNEKSRENLRPPFTPSEARYYGRIGAEKSIEARNRKKTIAETVDALLSEPITDPKHIKVIESSGIPIRGNPTYRDFLVASTITKAIKKGSVDDLVKLAGMLGEDAASAQRENGMLADLIDGLQVKPDNADADSEGMQEGSAE